MKLIHRVRQGVKWNTYLTQDGEIIAKSSTQEDKISMMIRSMLKYEPVWNIILAVTYSGDDSVEASVLTEKLVKDLTFTDVLKDSDTSNRRSRTLKAWVIWISNNSGIPIWLSEEGIQLSLFDTDAKRKKG